MIFVCEKKNWCVSKTTTLNKLLQSSSCEATEAITQEDIRIMLSGNKYDPSENRSWNLILSVNAIIKKLKYINISKYYI